VRRAHTRLTQGLYVDVATACMQLAGSGKDKAAGAGRGKPAKDKKAAGGNAKGANRSKAVRDEEEDDDDVGYTGLDDDDDDDDDAAGSDGESPDEEDEEKKETPAEKRVRLAKQYLEALARPAAAAEDEEAGSDLEEGDRDRIAARLLQDNLAGTSRLQVHIADQVRRRPCAVRPLGAACIDLLASAPPLLPTVAVDPRRSCRRPLGWTA